MPRQISKQTGDLVRNGHHTPKGVVVMILAYATRSCDGNFIALLVLKPLLGVK